MRTRWNRQTVVASFLIAAAATLAVAGSATAANPTTASASRSALLSPWNHSLDSLVGAAVSTRSDFRDVDGEIARRLERLLAPPPVGALRPSFNAALIPFPMVSLGVEGSF